MLQLFDDELAIRLLPQQPPGNLPLFRCDRAIVLDAPDRETGHDEKDRQQHQFCKIDRGVTEINERAEQSAEAGCRHSDPVAAKGGCEHNGREIRREYIAGSGTAASAPPVDKARHETAKPKLNGSDGGDVPCQPRRNSSNHFTMVTSDDHFHHASIQFKPTMAEIVTTYGGAITFRKNGRTPMRSRWMRPRNAWSALARQAGDIFRPDSVKRRT